MDDSEIIKLLFERNERAILAIIKKYEAFCKAIARNILRNEEDAEECVNDVYLKVWETIPPKKPPHLSTYIAKLTKNHALNILEKSTAAKRGGGAVELILDELEECVPDKYSVENELEGKELEDAINEFMKTLSEKNRLLFAGRYWYCFDIPELAANCGMSENNVSVTLNRLRNKLRKFLAERGFNV